DCSIHHNTASITMKNNNKNSHHVRPSLLASAILVGLGSLPVHAFELDTGIDDLQVRFDNTVKLNYAQRVESANSKLANAWNNNDGNRNFSAGSAVSQRIDVLHELDVIYRRQFGFRVSGNSWYDHAYNKVGSSNAATNQYEDGMADSRGLSSYA